MSTFGNLPVDWSAEYCKGRESMTTPGTDLERLQYVIGHLVLACPREMSTGFWALFNELIRRRILLGDLP